MIKKYHYSKLPIKNLLYMNCIPHEYYYVSEVPYSAVDSLTRIFKLSHPCSNIFCRYDNNKVDDIIIVNKLRKTYFISTKPDRILESQNLNEAIRSVLLAKAKVDTRDRYEAARKTVNIGRMRFKIDEKLLAHPNSRKRRLRFLFQYTNSVGGKHIMAIEFKTEGIFIELMKAARENGGRLTAKITEKVLLWAYDEQDIYVACKCPDFRYRFAYCSSIRHWKAGKPERRPAKKTNPKNRGVACKHIIKVLSNKQWIPKVANLVTQALRRRYPKFFK